MQLEPGCDNEPAPQPSVRRRLLIRAESWRRWLGHGRSPSRAPAAATAGSTTPSSAPPARLSHEPHTGEWADADDEDRDLVSRCTGSAPPRRDLLGRPWLSPRRRPRDVLRCPRCVRLLSGASATSDTHQNPRAGCEPREVVATFALSFLHLLSIAPVLIPYLTRITCRRSAKPFLKQCRVANASSSPKKLLAHRLAPGVLRGRGADLRAGWPRRELWPEKPEKLLPKEAALALDAKAGADGEGGQGAGVRPGCGAASARNVGTKLGQSVQTSSGKTPGAQAGNDVFRLRAPEPFSWTAYALTARLSTGCHLDNRYAAAPAAARAIEAHVVRAACSGDSRL
eukprot:COSAG04_NODE_842_length_9945_cov_4.243043_6_plen_341_part_00